MCFACLRVLRAFIFLRTLRGFIFLRALRAFIFYVPSFFDMCAFIYVYANKSHAN